jgi:DNA-binding PadR family transcriptional regulator
MARSNDPDDLLPLTPSVFHILVARSEGERHGYAIMRQVAEDTGGSLQLGPGTLYGCLQRMLAAGLVEESKWRPDPQLDDERRRYYRITQFGARVVRAEAKRLAAAVTAARARRLLPKGFGN